MGDSSRPLATESFSYSWLTHQKPSSSHDLLHILTSISTDKFNFDVPVSAVSSLVDADDIFSNGLIKPLYAHRSTKVEASKTTTTATSSVPGSPVSSINTLVNKNIYFIKKWRDSYRRILHKCFGFLKPLYQTLGSSRKNIIRVVDLDRKVGEIQNWSNSLEPSPRNSSDYDYDSVMDSYKFAKMDEKIDDQNGLKRAKSWSSSPHELSSPSQSWCDMESSIQEAILYCKRSIEK